MSLPRRIFILAVVSALLGFVALPVLAQSAKPDPISSEAYWQLVESSRDVVHQLNGLSAPGPQQGLEDLAKQWEAVTAVEVDGQIIPVDNRYLVAMLRADEPDLKQIDGVLSEWQTAEKKQPKHVFSGSERTALHTILARPEFAWADQAPNPLDLLIQKFLDALSKLWSRFFGDQAITLPINTLFPAVAASIILAAILVFVFHSLFQNFIQEAQLSHEEGAESQPLTSEVAFQKAQTLSQGGDYRTAVRYLYLSSLLLMDERGVIRYDRSKTNHEYLRSVSNSPELAGPLSEVIDVFDKVWYGYHSLEEETFKHYSDRVEELKEKKP